VTATARWLLLLLVPVLVGLIRPASALASQLAPSPPWPVASGDHREATLARARALVDQDRVDDAIATYSAWLDQHGDDLAAWREVAAAYQRAGRFRSAIAAYERAIALAPEDEGLRRRLASLLHRRAPAIEAGPLVVSGTGASVRGAQAGGDASIGDAARLAARVQFRRLDSYGEVATSRRVSLHTSFRPRATLRIDAEGGAVWLRPAGADAYVRPEVGMRVRHSSAGTGPVVDLRWQTGPIDVNSQLIGLDLIRTQMSAGADAPVGGRLRVRGHSRVGWLVTPGQRNVRFSLEGGPALRLAPGTHMSVQAHLMRYREAALAGYFSPRRAERLDLGLDLDRDFDTVSIGLDMGVGVQRFGRHDEPMTGWSPAVRLWSYAAWSLAPGRQLVVEGEAYRTQVAEFIATDDVERWRYGSLTASLRIALR
jgi:hypothetical protein